jgi:hypothetical protein
MQLVEGVGADPHGQEERGQSRGQAISVDDRRGGRAQRDVAEMPRRVGRV